MNWWNWDHEGSLMRCISVSALNLLIPQADAQFLTYRVFVRETWAPCWLKLESTGPDCFLRGSMAAWRNVPRWNLGNWGPWVFFSWEFSSSSARLRVAPLVVVTGIVTVRVVTEIVRSWVSLRSITVVSVCNVTATPPCEDMDPEYLVASALSTSESSQTSSRLVWPPCLWSYKWPSRTCPAPLPPGSQGSPARAGYGLDAASLEQHQVGGAVAAGHAGLVARSDFVPVVAGFGAARSAGVVHGAVFTLGGWREGKKKRWRLQNKPIICQIWPEFEGSSRQQPTSAPLSSPPLTVA